jgi:phage tail-like protein
MSSRAKLAYSTAKNVRPLQSQNFKLTMGPLETTYVTEVGGLSMDAKSVEVPWVGTANGMSDRLAGSISFGELTVKRPFRAGQKDFYEWIKKVRDLSDPVDYAVDGTIELYANNMKDVLAKWVIDGAWPSKWSISSLTAGGDESITEELTLQIEFLKREKVN